MKENKQDKTLLLPGEGLDPSRRAFLELAGFGISAVTLAGCSPGPMTKVVPGIVGSESYVAGSSYWVSTVCGACPARCGVLAKCRDGRPIKLEGNPSDQLTQGGLCATGQGDVLSLYDSRRLATPTREGARVEWSDVDASVGEILSQVSAKGGNVRLLTGTENGPSTRAAIARFLSAHPKSEHVAYDALSTSALLDAQAALFGLRALPSFRFDRAHVIASFGADFLGTWIAPVAFASDYAKGRRPDEGVMSTHIQLEGSMSMTGTVADRRVGLKPSEAPAALAGLCVLLERKAGKPARLGVSVPEDHVKLLKELAEVLWHARGHSLVVAGQNDLDVQLYTAYANHLLGNYGETLSLAKPSLQRMGDDGALMNLKAELDGGSVDCLILSGVNPAYDLPGDFAASVAKAGTVIYHGGQVDETSTLASFVLPQSHPLESWGDSEPVTGSFGLQQPAIPSIREARSLRHMLSAWAGDTRADRELLKQHWREELHRSLDSTGDFESFFLGALNAGFVARADGQAAEPDFVAAGLPAGGSVAQSEGGLELVLYPKVGLLDGKHAHNPWLQEMPSPVTKVSWDNYISVSPARAEALGVELGDLVRITVDEHSLELPALVQRGQLDNVVSVALGYGRKGTDRFSEVGPSWLEGRRTVQPGATVGVNIAPMLGFDGGSLSYVRTGIKLTKASGHVDLAATQEHHSLEIPKHLSSPGAEVRDAVLTASFLDYSTDPENALHRGHHPAESDLWPADHEPPHHHWGMVVDLSSCTGCSACVVSCQAENNVPVVGKDEVLRHREMHWMRIDRYFEGEGGAATASHQPMFCQQCDNAPCEGVCPVLATVHSDEGLNQQVYNRCVGTRYCANTCPYKVRRFNWFDYPREDKLENHSLNPDVTVRTRGVMEKCSFCSQRIQEARSEAIRKGVPIAEGDIQVACQQSCPTRAIVFGDLMDPESSVSKLMQRRRSYKVLEELNVKPSVSYLARIRNRAEEDAHHG
ncbi:MAG: Fe-S-cluster-containing dehydrogenase component [Planctomycetota bacterium]